MLIAWQTVNAVLHTVSMQLTRGFLVVAPGLTIKDRLRVLLPLGPGLPACASRPGPLYPHDPCELGRRRADAA